MKKEIVHTLAYTIIIPMLAPLYTQLAIYVNVLQKVVSFYPH